MKQYLDLGKHILENGAEKADRTGTGTISTFGYQMRFRLQDGFPLLTTKDMMVENNFGVTRLDQIIYELLWFLDGDTNIKTLVDKGVNIWNRDAYKAYTNNGGEDSYKEFVQAIREDHDFAKQHGSIGAGYGAQWRSWTVERFGEIRVIDQISQVIESLKENPDSRRHIVSAWNVGDLDKMVLPPCHTLFQFYVQNGTLSCQLYQRSGDYFLGIPFNIASYSLLTMMIAQCVGLAPGEFIHTIGDAHIYTNHVEQVKEQLTREPRELPVMNINPFKTDIFSFEREDFELEGYDPHPELKGAQSF